MVSTERFGGDHPIDEAERERIRIRYQPILPILPFSVPVSLVDCRPAFSPDAAAAAFLDAPSKTLPDLTRPGSRQAL